MTTEICKHCNGWRGLHKWDTMQCPYMGMENENWQATTYEEADDKDARIAELEARVKELEAWKSEARQVLTSIVANPAVQDKIEADKRTNYLIRDARALLETK